MAGMRGAHGRVYMDGKPVGEIVEVTWTVTYPVVLSPRASRVMEAFGPVFEFPYKLSNEVAAWR